MDQEREDEGLDRDRGVLTSRDRRYLTGEKDVQGQRERNIRMTIRKRAANAIRDFVLIAEEMPVRDQEQVLDELDDDEVEAYLEALKITVKYVEHYHEESGQRAALLDDYRSENPERKDGRY